MKSGGTLDSTPGSRKQVQMKREAARLSPTMDAGQPKGVKGR